MRDRFKKEWKSFKVTDDYNIEKKIINFLLDFFIQMNQIRLSNWSPKRNRASNRVFRGIEDSNDQAVVSG